MMLNPTDSPDLQIAKQQKIIAALLHQFERRQDMGGSAYALFQSAMELESQVREKTQDLERALNTIGERNTELNNIYTEHNRDLQSLADTLEVMNEGYALVKDGYLAIVNDRFRRLLPDVSNQIYAGARVQDVFEAFAQSKALALADDVTREEWLSSRITALGKDRSSFVLPLTDDRWFNVTYQRTSLGNMAIMQSDITDLVRKNRFEKDQIIGKNSLLLQAVFEHLSLAICLVSGQGEVKSCNQRFLRLLGIVPEDLQRNSSLRSVIATANAKTLMKEPLSLKQLQTWSQSLGALQEVRHRLEMSNGTILDMKLMALPDGEFIVTFDDVTEETRAKIALVEANEQLEDRVAGRTAALMSANQQLKERARRQAEFERQLLEAKNAAEEANRSKTRFLAAASHDLLQPINAAKLYISTLTEVVRSQESKGLAEKVAASFQSIESILQSLLEISRLEGDGAKFNVTEFCLDDVLTQLAVEFAPQAALKGLQFDLVGSKKWVLSDKTYLRRIVANLISNAIEYTQEGRILVGCRAKGDRLKIEVWDTGIGISKENHQVIFEEFQRLAPARDVKGIGLGLSIVERACKKLGHELTMRSKPVVGSVFAVELDLVAEMDMTDADQSLNSEAQIDTSDLIALVIENDQEVLNAMIGKLETWGVSVLPATSTEGALTAMRQMGLAPDVIIADYQLDDGDNGFDAIERLRTVAKKEIPAIIVTGNQSAALEYEGETRRIEVLRKPVPLRKLRSLLGWKTRSSNLQSLEEELLLQ